MINPEPRTFEGVKGYIANNGANITPGFYRNYHYISDNTNNNGHIHQVNSKATTLNVQLSCVLISRTLKLRYFSKIIAQLNCTLSVCHYEIILDQSKPESTFH